MNHCLRICAVLVVAMLQASVPAEETFNRGLIAVVNDQGHVYLGWRLLKDDPADVAFNVYRRTGARN
jgi:rhamnogalacturonan endolyase